MHADDKLRNMTWFHGASSIAFMVGAVMSVSSAHAALMVYQGQWNNLTFGSSGDAEIGLDVEGDDAAGYIDLDGLVFGSVDPPALNFLATMNPDGSFTVTPIAGDPVFGDVTGSRDADGNVTITTANLPLLNGGSMTLSGTFDGITWDLTYVISAFGQEEFANGTLVAVIPEPGTLGLLVMAGVAFRRRGR